MATKRQKVEETTEIVINEETIQQLHEVQEKVNNVRGEMSKKIAEIEQEFVSKNATNIAERSALISTIPDFWLHVVSLWVLFSFNLFQWIFSQFE